MTSDPSSAVLSTPRRAHTHQELAEVRSELPLQATGSWQCPMLRSTASPMGCMNMPGSEPGLPTLNSGNITGCSHYEWGSSSHKNGCATAIDAGVASSPCFRLWESRFNQL